MLIQKHFLATEIENMKCGVEACNYIKTKLNPLANDHANESANALASLNSLELNTMKKGSCEKFIALFERKVDQVLETAPAQSMIYTEEYLRTLLVGKLLHENYA